ncbi:MAG: universal stress protein [Vicinamibacterales bacterium]
MLEIRRILCPVDFSDASQHALDHAVMIAGWYRARITALHVRHPAFLVEPPILFTDMGGGPAATLEDAESRLHHWLSPVRAAGIACDVMAVDGNTPAARIVEVAERIGADLIVLGTHGRSGFERLLLGSVTERVVRTARCPVVTVPPPTVSTSKLPFKRVICGVDFSDPSMAAYQVALSLARESDSQLTLLHVLEFPAEDRADITLPFDMAAYRAAVQEDSTRRMLALITDDVKAWCTPVTSVVHGRPYEQILAAAAATSADLIVLGVHGRNALDLMLFGSTTNQVIRRATCPVLTLAHR